MQAGETTDLNNGESGELEPNETTDLNNGESGELEASETTDLNNGATELTEGNGEHYSAWT